MKPCPWWNLIWAGFDGFKLSFSNYPSSSSIVDFCLNWKHQIHHCFNNCFKTKLVFDPFFSPNYIMFLVGPIMLSTLHFVLLEMMMLWGRNLKNKFGAHMMFCSIPGTQHVWLKIDVGFSFTLPCWAFLCVCFKFWKYHWKIELLMMNVYAVYAWTHYPAQKFPLFMFVLLLIDASWWWCCLNMLVPMLCLLAMIFEFNG